MKTYDHFVCCSCKWRLVEDEEEEECFSVLVKTTHKQSHYIREIKSLRIKILGDLFFYF